MSEQEDWEQYMRYINAKIQQRRKENSKEIWRDEMRKLCESKEFRELQKGLDETLKWMNTITSSPETSKGKGKASSETSKGKGEGKASSEPTVCRYGDKCRYRGKCTFAHPPSEKAISKPHVCRHHKDGTCTRWKEGKCTFSHPLKCRYGTDCRKQGECHYLHPPRKASKGKG